MNVSLIESSNAFGLTTEGISCGNGHINSTFVAEKNGDMYILQLINTDVFKNPADMMNNICKVTEHIKNKVMQESGDVEREVMNMLSTVDGKNFFVASNGDTYRAYKYIKDSITIEGNPTPEEFVQAGFGFGRFQKYLADFPAEELVETIADFHHTPKRIEKIKESIKTDKYNRVKNCEDVIDYILKNEAEAGIVIDGIKSGDIPIRVTHNDTKLNNILFDKDTKKAVCVIDLDTVMPGSLLYDFGDAIRYGTSTAAEDEKDLDKVAIDLKLFKSFTEGFSAALRDTYTKTEAELLPFSAKLLTYELVVRFLDDYLNGDTYFKTKYLEHNLIRAKNQMKICQDIDLKINDMHKIVTDILR